MVSKPEGSIMAAKLSGQARADALRKLKGWSEVRSEERRVGKECRL